MQNIMEINHRELVASSLRKNQLAFSRLPIDLQDSIIEGFDSGNLLLREARKLIEDRGFKLSCESISDYYRAIKVQRRELLREALRGRLEACSK